VRALDELGRRRIAALDPGGQFAAVAGLADQLEEGWAAAREAAAEALAPRPAAAANVFAAVQAPDGIAVCGMGGSAICADVVRGSLAGVPLPYEVVRGYAPPAWVSPRTLVVCISYSGDTEEALACVRKAHGRGCAPICIASGGALAGLAAEHGWPLIPVPGGRQPRHALGYLTAALAAALDAAGVAAGLAEQVAEAAELVRVQARELGPAVPEKANPAKQLARLLHGRLALVYGGGVTAAAARRWKGEINENAKAPAAFAELPELDHNEIVGWTGAPQLAAQTAVILLVDPLGDPRLQRRAQVTADYVGRYAAAVELIVSRGAGPLARCLTAAYVGDWVSLYLALLYGVDPTPVAAIDELKARLAAPSAELAAPPQA
jgi:glucose/mannose-6-phosphate isomerase